MKRTVLTSLMSILTGLLICGCYEQTYYPQQQPYASTMTYYPTGSYTAPAITQTPPASHSLGSLGVNKYNPNSLANPYGAGSPYKTNGLMNPYSKYGSPYSNQSWRNPYATDAPKLYDSKGNYRGKLSTNPYDPDSVSNPFGRYGSKFSPDSINNPFGAGNPYSYNPIYVVPSTR